MRDIFESDNNLYGRVIEIVSTEWISACINFASLDYATPYVCLRHDINAKNGEIHHSRRNALFISASHDMILESRVRKHLFMSVTSYERLNDGKWHIYGKYIGTYVKHLAPLWF